MKNDIKDDLSNDIMKETAKLVQPGFVKQASQTYPINRN
jgi:hypothetical protein